MPCKSTKKDFTKREECGIIKFRFKDWQKCIFGPVAQLGERTVRIREVRGFDPLRVHQIGNHRSENCGDFSFDHINTTDGFQKIFGQFCFRSTTLFLWILRPNIWREDTCRQRGVSAWSCEPLNRIQATGIFQQRNPFGRPARNDALIYSLSEIMHSAKLPPRLRFFIVSSSVTVYQTEFTFGIEQIIVIT